jgi:sugar phosphate isomerase/epimerase
MKIAENPEDPQLSLCWGSMEGVGLVEFLSAAAQTGFDAVTLNTALYLEGRAAGFVDGDFSQLLADHGLFVSNIDPLFNWLPSAVRLEGNDPISVCTRASADEIFHLAHVAGTDLVNAPVGLATPNCEQEIVDAFATLCERAAQHKMRVCLEFMPFTWVADLSTAVRVVEKANCSNGGIMFDCWHHHRSGGKAADILAIPGDNIFALQLDDAARNAHEDIIEETLNHRELPGQGCIDLTQTLRNLDQIGARFVYDVEVFNIALRSKPPLVRAQKMYEAANTIISNL